jgi:amphi-Trp domain-containing protein
MVELLEIENERTLSREEAAAWLRSLADELARNNQLQLRKEGLKYTIRVPAQVTMEVEVEIEDDGAKLEVELSW